jgi:hypothetical protein
VAGVRWLEAGVWQPAADLAWPGGLGRLVLGGFPARHIDVVGRPAAELVGPGDLLRPWERDRTEPFSSPTRWHALEPCYLAVSTCACPRSSAARPTSSRRSPDAQSHESREHAVGLAVGQIPNMRLRLLVVLWHIAHARAGRPAGAARP